MADVIVIRGLPSEPRALRPAELTNLDPALSARLTPRIERLGYLGAFFAYAAHQPAALTGFVDFTESLKDSLPDGLAEVVALAAATVHRNEYELVQHVRRARVLGFSDEWIAQATGDDGGSEAPSAGLSDDEAIVRDLTLAVLRDAGHSAGSRFDEVVDRLGAETATGVLLLIGRYSAHACVANTLGLTAPEGVQ